MSFRFNFIGSSSICRGCDWVPREPIPAAPSSWCWRRVRFLVRSSPSDLGGVRRYPSDRPLLWWPGPTMPLPVAWRGSGVFLTSPCRDGGSRVLSSGCPDIQIASVEGRSPTAHAPTHHKDGGQCAVGSRPSSGGEGRTALTMGHGQSSFSGFIQKSWPPMRPEASYKGGQDLSPPYTVVISRADVTVASPPPPLVSASASATLVVGVEGVHRGVAAPRAQPRGRNAGATAAAMRSHPCAKEGLRLRSLKPTYREGVMPAKPIPRPGEHSRPPPVPKQLGGRYPDDSL